MTSTNDPDATVHGSGHVGSDQTNAVRKGSGSRGTLVQPLVAGTVLGRYEIIECIDSGGMGVVYRARHTALGKSVALKVVSARLQSEPRVMERFLREMQAVGRLEPHPHVLNAYDAGEEDGMQYIATELIEGIQLGNLVSRIGPLSVSEACKIISQAALALEHFRKHELVHRDIKPSNLMLTRGGIVKVVDLGLALLRDEEVEQITVFGETMGSIDYMAPEQWHDCHKVDWRSDVYSLGCTFYCLLVGHAPYNEKQQRGSVAKMRAHLESDFPDIREKRSDVPDAAAELLASMVDKDPDRRSTDLVELSNQLDIIASGDLKGLVTRGFADKAKKRSWKSPPKSLGALPSQARPVRARSGSDDDLRDADPDALTQTYPSLKALVKPGSEGAKSIFRTAIVVVTLGVVSSLFGFLVWRVFNPTDLDGGATVIPGDVRESEIPLPLPEPSPSFAIAVDPVSYSGHESNVLDVAFLTPKNQIASVCKAGQLCISDLANPDQPRVSVAVSGQPADSLAYDSETDTLVIVGADGSIQICSVQDGHTIQKQSLLNVGFTSVVSIPGTTAFATSDWNGDIRRIDLSVTPSINELIASRDDVVFDVEVSADGEVMAWVGRDPVVTVYRVAEKEATDLTGHQKWVYDIAISPDGSRMATAGHEGVVRIWQLPKGEPANEIPYVVPQAVCFFPDSRHLAIGGRGKKVQVWDLELNRPVQQMSVGHDIDSLAVSADGKLLAAGANDGTLKVWSFESAP